MTKEVTIEGEVYIVTHLKSGNGSTCDFCALDCRDGCPHSAGMPICVKYDTILKNGRRFPDAYFVKKEDKK